MFRTSGLKTVMRSLTAVIAVLTLACHSAEAQVKPFKITGEGIAPMGLPLPGQDARPHWIAGNATHLGRHYGEGTVQTDTATFHLDGRITGEFGGGEPFVFTGANGDILSCEYGRTEFGASTPGTFELVPVGPPGIYVAVFIAEFVPVPAECTGKFAGVTGSWVMYAVTEPFVLGSADPIDYSWEGQGSLKFKKGK